MLTLNYYSNLRPEEGLKTIDLPGQFHSLDDLTPQLPAGVYTTFRTFHKFKMLNFQAHVQRLESSAGALGKELVINPDALRAYLHAALESHPAEENRVRVVVAWDHPSGDETIYLALEELHPPASRLYQTGVRVNTVALRRTRPEAKATDFIQLTKALRAEITDGLNELLMVDDSGTILEGLSSNFFAVRDQVVCTAASGVLPGITRSLVLEIIQRDSIPLIWTGTPLAEIGQLQEAFITSASRGVMPVVQINETTIGTGAPGPITRRLMQEYAAEIEKRIDPI